jgi:hypothetical protein
MAKRPIFLPGNSTAELVEEVNIDFEWHPGFSIQQKQKSIRSLHLSAKESGINSVLEISTKSPLQLGKELSAFNLQYRSKNFEAYLEAAFQGSKVFKGGGPFANIYNLLGVEAKRDKRLRTSGNLIGFDFLGVQWSLEPKTAFYDWIYINALHQNISLASQLSEFDGFSDIEFNPAKSFNCQARSAALYLSLEKNHLLVEALSDKESYLQIISPGSKKKTFDQSPLPGLS